MKTRAPLLALLLLLPSCREAAGPQDGASDAPQREVAADSLAFDAVEGGDPLDGAAESSLDAAVESAAETSVDAVLDATQEASAEAAVEAGAEASMEAGADGSAPDAAVTDAAVGEAGTLSPAAIPERRVTCGPRVGTPSVTAGAADRYVVRGRIVTPVTVLARGEVLVSGDRITCVAADCSAMMGYAGATIVETAGMIYPGLLDTHNHPAYNWLPPWTPPRLYGNHSQWQGATAYSTFVTPYRDNSGAHECAMTKYGEVRSLLAGTTSLQGAPNRTCVKGTIVRNLEYATDFMGVDHHQTNVLGISTVSTTAATTLRANMDSGALTAYILHLAEGVDETARMEYDLLTARNLITPALVVVHGTAGHLAELSALGAARSKLVWSPRSNVILYGGTTDIRTALAQGVQVSLAPDWTPSGGPNVLSEMRYARYVSRTLWGGLLTDRDLVEMVTTRAASNVDRGTMVGTLAPGFFADLMVIPDTGCDPYSALVDAPMADIQLVMVGGRFLYGLSPLMTAMPAAAQANCEDLTVCGGARRVCVSLGPTAADGKDQTVAQITAEIASFYPTPYPLAPPEFCP